MQEFNELLRELLNRLDVIAVEHPEVDDTAVREEMSAAILNGFGRKIENYKLPNKFAMFSAKGNADVLTAMAYFVGNSREVACLNTFSKRLTAFQNLEIVSDGGHAYDWYFGRWDTKDFDEDGNRLDGRDI